MNYPYWDVGPIGGGPLIGLIAVVHVYIAHLAVGGGLFIWWLDATSRRRPDAVVEGFLRRYNWVFLLVTMVFGGVTGVGIWFIIGLVQPAATSSLIHSFVFGWAIEWVFFVAEIVALLVYHYRFDALERGVRTRVAFFYALFAWLSLFVINGILAYMLTPGRWVETGDFWHGFFNPTFWPSLVFRTLIAVLFAGVFGMLVGAWQRDATVRQRMVGLSGRWVLGAAVGLVPAGLWYYTAVPVRVRETAFGLNPETAFWGAAFLASSALVVVLTLLVVRGGPRRLQRVVGVVVAILGLVWMGGFETLREFARRPYVIHGVMYSNGVRVADAERISEAGALASARWVPASVRDGDDEQARGEALFGLQCVACHTVGGRNDILPLTAGWTFQGMQAHLAGLGRVRDFMPPFVGTTEERDALAAYIVSGLHGAELVRAPEPFEPQSGRVRSGGFTMPATAGRDDHVLLAWSDLGVHSISDSDPWFVIQPPGNTLEAQLIRRGETPELVTEGVTVTYSIDSAFAHPSRHVPFWRHAKSVFGEDLPPDVGLGGVGTNGALRPTGPGGAWIVQGIPIVPYRDDGVYDPYPLVTLEARDEETDDLLARTAVVAPVSTEMGCRHCHGGAWRVAGRSGISDETARNILATHDALSGTHLLADALAGKPRLCQSCHADPAVGTPGVPGVLNFSAAMHGFHANYMPVEGETACGLCHPSSPGGHTRFLRGVHKEIGLTCVDCHGALQDHALALLNAERAAGKPGAARLGAKLRPDAVATADDVSPRAPWVQQPDCLACHVGFRAPDESSTFNDWVPHEALLYRTRTDTTGLRCAACHGAPHALYPARNDFEPNIDNIASFQLMGAPGPIGSEKRCTICHTTVLDGSGHHPNMLRAFRNDEIIEGLMESAPVTGR